MSHLPERFVDFYLAVMLPTVEARGDTECVLDLYTDAGEVDGEFFLRQAIFVVLQNGLSSKGAETLYEKLEQRIADWSPRAFGANESRYRAALKSVVGSEKKVDAILMIAAELERRGVGHFLDLVEKQGPEALQIWPQIGPKNCRHLAKNVGFQVAVDDRHMVELAEALGTTPTVLSEELSDLTGDTTAVVDFVLWDYVRTEGMELVPTRPDRHAGVSIRRETSKAEPKPDPEPSPPAKVTARPPPPSTPLPDEPKYSGTWGRAEVPTFVIKRRKQP